MFKRRRIRYLRRLQKRYIQELEQKKYRLDFDAYLLTIPERKTLESEYGDLSKRVEALGVVIDDLYLQLNGKIDLD